MKIALGAPDIAVAVISKTRDKVLGRQPRFPAGVELYYNGGPACIVGDDLQYYRNPHTVWL